MGQELLTTNPLTASLYNSNIFWQAKFFLPREIAIAGTDHVPA
jgi:hypothetical protein